MQLPKIIQFTLPDFTSTCFDFFPFHLVSSVNPLNSPSANSAFFGLLTTKTHLAPSAARHSPFKLLPKLFIRRNQSWFEIIMEIMENQSNQWPPKDAFVFRFSFAFCFWLSRTLSERESLQKSSSTNETSQVTYRSICMCGWAVRWKEMKTTFFACMPQSTSTPTPPSGAPLSRAICLHHCQLQVVVLQCCSGEVVVTADGRRCGGQASGTGRSVATAAAARNWVTNYFRAKCNRLWLRQSLCICFCTEKKYLQNCCISLKKI